MDENETFERPYKEEELLEFVREGKTGGKGTWLGRRLLPVRAQYYMQELEDGTIDLETALLELNRLASDMDLQEVRQWTRDEAKGYAYSRHSHLPAYRMPPCETVTFTGCIDGEFHDHLACSPILLPLEVNQLLGTVGVWDGIPMLEESEDLYKGLTIDVSHLSDDLCEATDGMFDCALIKQEVSGEQLTKIMEAVRDRVSHELEGIIDIFD